MFNFKVVFTLLIAVSCISATAAPGQLSMEKPAKEHSFGLGVEPLWLLIGGIGAKADYRLSSSVSLGLGGMIVPSQRNTNSDTNATTYKWSAYEIYLGPTFMITGDYDSNGIYITPAVGYIGSKISEYSSFNLSGKLETYQGRVTAGYQWVSKKSFRVALGAGLRALGSSDVVVKDNNGKEVLRQRSSTSGGLVLDGTLGFLF